MANNPKNASPFTGFGIGTLPKTHRENGVFILVIYRDGSLTAAAHATERSAMESAAYSWEDERDEDEEAGTLEDRFARAQRIITDDGGVMEIVPSPIIGA